MAHPASKYDQGKRMWEKIKKNPFLLEKRREAQRRWVKKHRGEIRERSNEYRKEMRKISEELGNCTNCHKEKDNPLFKMCSRCRQKNRLKKLKQRRLT